MIDPPPSFSFRNLSDRWSTEHQGKSPSIHSLNPGDDDYDDDERGDSTFQIQESVRTLLHSDYLRSLHIWWWWWRSLEPALADNDHDHINTQSSTKILQNERNWPWKVQKEIEGTWKLWTLLSGNLRRKSQSSQKGTGQLNTWVNMVNRVNWTPAMLTISKSVTFTIRAIITLIRETRPGIDTKTKHPLTRWQG